MTKDSGMNDSRHSQNCICALTFGASSFDYNFIRQFLKL